MSKEQAASTLCVTVRFLAATYHGRDCDGDPEWPPSPFRLFQALVAAAGGTRTQSEHDGLVWLELQNAPAITAAEPLRKRPAHRLTYVPNNDTDRAGHIASPFEKRYATLHLPQGTGDHDRPEVQYRWPVTATDRLRAEVVARLASRLRVLGWGIDVIAARGQFDAIPPRGTGWTSDQTDTFGKKRRVPMKGSLKSLDDSHHAKSERFAEGVYTPLDTNVVYTTVTYLPSNGLISRPFVVFRLVDRDGDAFREWPARARDVAAMVRHAAHAAAIKMGCDDATVRGIVCGHGPAEGATPPAGRLSYLPLPSVGHEHTDGLIRRVLIAGPAGGDDGLLGKLAKRLIGRPLVREADGAVVATLAPCDPNDADERVVARYLDAAAVWATVTPIVMPGFNARAGAPDFDGWHSEPAAALDGDTRGAIRKTHKLVLKLLAAAGVTPEAVASVTLQRLPFWPNLPAAPAYRRPENLRRRPAFHARVVFRRPVRGPIALGDGRFRGLGLLAGVAD